MEEYKEEEGAVDPMINGMLDTPGATTNPTEPPNNPPKNPFKQSITEWLISCSLPPQINELLSVNSIDTVELLSHCSKGEIDDISQLLRDELPKICNTGERAPSHSHTQLAPSNILGECPSFFFHCPPEHSNMKNRCQTQVQESYWRPQEMQNTRIKIRRRWRRGRWRRERENHDSSNACLFSRRP